MEAFDPRSYWESRLAETYNGQPLCLASLGAQKSHMALYLMCVYGDAKLRQWFEKAFKASGKKLDMGKACVRFKKLDALPLDVISEAISKVSVDAYVDAYEKVQASTKTGKKAAAKVKSKAKAKTKAPTSRRTKTRTASSKRRTSKTRRSA